MNTRLVRGNPGASSDVPRVLRRASASRAGLFLLLAGLLFPAFAQATATANDDGPIPVVRDTSRVIDVLANDTATVPLLLTIVSVDNPTAQGGKRSDHPGHSASADSLHAAVRLHRVRHLHLSGA